jgi:hypothetical protein
MGGYSDKCPVCGRWFTDRAALRQHINSHKGNIMGKAKTPTVWPQIKNQGQDVANDLNDLILKTPTSEVRNFLCDAQICINEAMKLAEQNSRG